MSHHQCREHLKGRDYCTFNVSHCGLLVQSIQDQLLVVRHTTWQALCLLCRLLELILQTVCPDQARLMAFKSRKVSFQAQIAPRCTYCKLLTKDLLNCPSQRTQRNTSAKWQIRCTVVINRIHPGFLDDQSQPCRCSQMACTCVSMAQLSDRPGRRFRMKA